MAISAKTTSSSFYYRTGRYLLIIACLMLTMWLVSRLVPYGGTVAEDRVNITLPEITIPQGRIQGVNMVTLHNRTVFGFTGIPYARPPVGDLRFEGPLPPTPWKGILKSNLSTVCVQMDPNGKIVGDEDCLNLNVYTPKLLENGDPTLLPVMMYIIGEQYQRENAGPLDFGPDFLLDKDVVLVVPNFRVGVLGFLSTGDEVSPGNNGLKDVVRALEWNRDNIQYFGGDPERVTLYGTSAGATSVGLLTMSDSTEGLFHRTIEESGSALNPMLQEPNEVAVKRAFMLGAHLGCPTNTSTLLVNCLRSLDAELLVNTTSPFRVPDFVPFIPWLPTTEPKIEGALLTETPEKMFASGKTRDISTIFCIARDEGVALTAAFYVDSEKFDSFLDRIDYLLPHLLSYTHSVVNVTAYTAALKSYYLNDLTANKSLLLSNLTQLAGDISFSYPEYRAQKQKLALAKSPQYFCSFEHRGVFSLSYYWTGSTQDMGVPHGEGRLYVFRDHTNLYGPSSYRYSESDLKLVDTMVGLWTSFATNGTPYAAGPNGENIWEPYSTRKNYLRIGNGPEIGLEVKYAWYQHRMDFLDELFAQTEWK